MGGDRRSAIGRVASAWATTLAVALAASAAAFNPGGQASPPALEGTEAEAPARPQEPAGRPRAVPREVRKADPEAEGKAESGGLRLPPAGDAAGDFADRPAADPLAPDAMPAANGAAPPAAGAAAAAPPDQARPAADPNAPVVPRWPFLYELTLAAADGAPMFARYYPSQEGASAAVVLLVHDLAPGRSIKDFDDPIDELDGVGLAGTLQQEGYAVLAVDQRGFGRSPSRLPESQATGRRVADLQAAYRFLLDRHNRRELNLAKLAVVGLGAGANLAASWAATPGGAVSIEGRTSDLAGLVLVSPRADLAGQPLERGVSALAPRFPILLLTGSGDAAAAEVARALEPIIARQRLSKVASVETRLPATNLLRFAPGATRPLTAFLADVVRVRADEWEPRYNLAPVLFADVRVVNLGDEPAPAPAAGTAPAAPREGAAAPPADAGPPAPAGSPRREP